MLIILTVFISVSLSFYLAHLVRKNENNKLDELNDWLKKFDDICTKNNELLEAIEKENQFNKSKQTVINALGSMLAMQENVKYDVQFLNKFKENRDPFLDAAYKPPPYRYDFIWHIENDKIERIKRDEYILKQEQIDYLNYEEDSIERLAKKVLYGNETNV